MLPYKSVFMSKEDYIKIHREELEEECETCGNVTKIKNEKCEYCGTIQ